MCNPPAWVICSLNTPSKSIMTEMILLRMDGMDHSVSVSRSAVSHISILTVWLLLVHSLGECIGFLGAIPCCVCCPNPFKPVAQGEVGLVTKFGRFVTLIFFLLNIHPNLTCRFERSVDPGLVKINPISEHLDTVDVKIQIVEVPRQVCMTKDNVTLNLTSVIYYQVTSPHKAAFGISNIKQALVERTQTTLRHVIGARVLQDVIERREEIAQSTSEIIEEVA